MKCLHLLLMCWCSSIPTVTSRFNATVNLSGQALSVSGNCVTAYWSAATCVLNITDNPVGSSTYTLNFTDYYSRDKTYSCPLVMMNHSYSCVCKLTKLEEYDKYIIKLCDKSGCVILEPKFEPSGNIQLTPPQVEVQETPFNISWKSGYKNHIALRDYIIYELLLQTSQGEESKEWLTTKSKFVLTYKPEEILITDTVTVMPKPVAKGPEENQDLHNPSVTHLTFTQCQTSYVGLPGIHDVPPPLTMICAAETSYTQLPCTVWGVGSEEADVVPSPPKDLLNISHADSGCSCEELSQSLECSEPSSPVVDSPPSCYCTDYCILNKTAEGFAPVLVSKGSSLNVPSDSLQEGKS
ncbi:hypothetical protein D9C73_016620 [Collichthys lucidus]|uniref:Interleukin-4 receptor subunit alpha n=1 Tax=Collichthys lucidus TaxID=240159 RepID=A0A4U5V5G0_COLLU|nr:hypothetical protein D9C73_016620 [Collichthys lucidus]